MKPIDTSKISPRKAMAMGLKPAAGKNADHELKEPNQGHAEEIAEKKAEGSM